VGSAKPGGGGLREPSAGSAPQQKGEGPHPAGPGEWRAGVNSSQYYTGAPQEHHRYTTGVGVGPHPTDPGERRAGVSDELAGGQHGLKGQRLHQQGARHGLPVGARQEGLHVDEGETVHVVLPHPVAQRIQNLHSTAQGHARGAQGCLGVCQRVQEGIAGSARWRRRSRPRGTPPPSGTARPGSAQHRGTPGVEQGVQEGYNRGAV